MVWTFCDTKRAAAASALPLSVMGYAFYAISRDKAAIEWWENAKKPRWAPKDIRLYGTIDALTFLSLGPCSYLVYKHGGGFDFADTRLALGLYGATSVLFATAIPLSLQRSIKWLFYNQIFLNVSAVATAYVFYKIHKPAGLCMVPYSLWMSFYTVLLYFMRRDEKKNNAP